MLVDLSYFIFCLSVLLRKKRTLFLLKQEGSLRVSVSVHLISMPSATALSPDIPSRLKEMAHLALEF